MMATSTNKPNKGIELRQDDDRLERHVMRMGGKRVDGSANDKCSIYPSFSRSSKEEESFDNSDMGSSAISIATMLMSDDEVPVQDVSLNTVHALVNLDLCRLTREERDRALNDVHAVAHQRDESPSFVQDRLNKLDAALNRLVHADGIVANSNTKRATNPFDFFPTVMPEGAKGQEAATSSTYAYSLACQSDRAYVEDPGFRLRFLRAVGFDVAKAAERVVSHFRLKLDLFGQENVGKRILRDDLEEDDLRSLYSGSRQLLPARDRAGRAVFVSFPSLSCNDAVPIRNKLRSHFYALMETSESEETQRNGVVEVAYFVGAKFHSGAREMAWKFAKLVDAMPIRVVAVHFCSDTHSMHPVISLALLATTACMRIRQRTHNGTRTECLEQLRAFGIPTYCMPFNDDGEPSAKQAGLRWERHRGQESEMTGTVSPGGCSNPPLTSSDGDDEYNNPDGAAVIPPNTGRTALASVAPAVQPRPSDVLLGRGRHLVNHPGNRRFRLLIDRYLGMYESFNHRLDKTVLSYTIVRIVKEDLSGRFLKEADDGKAFHEVDDGVAHAKVAHCFRSQRSAMRKTVL